MDWQVPDPVGLPLEEARPIRDQIARLVRGLLDAAEEQLDKTPSAPKDNS